ncbi:hypothetical protein HanRHA438_Chr12g0557121 [Helianthus annuus]|nr:hypothetical protein HanRHA438_Chr12g0557121 [Helianthus annuus]
MAAATRFWFFLSLVLLSFTISETRLITANLSKDRNGGVLIDKAREILEENTQRHDMEELKARYSINRRSPGGPDPKHH